MILLGAGERGQRRGQAGGGHACGPDDGSRRDPPRHAVRLADRDAGLVDVDYGAAEHGRDAEPAQRALGVRRQRRREAREHAVGGLDEQDAAAAGIRRAEVAAQRVAGELGDLAGHLDAGGTGADHGEGQPLVAPLGIALELRGLEGGEQAAADGQRALEDFTSAACALHSSWPK